MRACFVPVPNHNEFKERIAEDMEHLVLSCLESRSEGNGSIYGRFLLGPFKVGQGTTVATALRRTLLSELQGIAISAVEIKGATHQYSSIAGVRESTLDIVLNLKQIVLTGDVRNGLPAVGYLAVQGPKAARARDLKLPNGIRCVDGDQYIASVSANGSLTMKFVISAGKNYVSPHSPSAHTLAPSLFQPKIREGGTTPLALRASGQPLHGLVEMVGGNSPLDPKHGQPALIRGGRRTRRSGHIGDIFVSHATRRVAYSTPPSNTSRTLRAAAFAAGAETTGTNGPSRLAGLKVLPTPLRSSQDGLTETTLNHGTSKPFPVPSLPGTISDLSPRSSIERQTVQRNAEPLGGKDVSLNGTGPLPVRRNDELLGGLGSLGGLRGLGHQGSVGSRGTEQSSLGRPGNAREAEKLKDGGQFLGMPLNGAQPPNATFNLHQPLKGLVQGDKQWEMDSSPLPIDAVFMPVNKVNFSLQIDDQWQEPRERVILEIWTNGSLHPRQAIGEAASYLVYLFSLLRQGDASPAATVQPSPQLRGLGWGTADQRGRTNLQSVEGGGREGEGSSGGMSSYRATIKHPSPRALPGPGRDRSTDIADLDLSIQAYALLKRAGVHTFRDVMSLSLNSIKGGGLASPAILLEIDALIKRLAVG